MKYPCGCILKYEKRDCKSSFCLGLSCSRCRDYCDVLMGIDMCYKCMTRKERVMDGLLLKQEYEEYIDVLYSNETTNKIYKNYWLKDKIVIEIKDIEEIIEKPFKNLLEKIFQLRKI